MIYYTVLLSACSIFLTFSVLSFAYKKYSITTLFAVAMPVGLFVSVYPMSLLALHDLHIKVRKWYLLTCLAALAMACIASAIMTHIWR